MYNDYMKKEHHHFYSGSSQAMNSGPKLKLICLRCSPTNGEDTYIINLKIKFYRYKLLALG